MILRIQTSRGHGNADCPFCGRVNQERYVWLYEHRFWDTHCSACVESPAVALDESERRQYEAAKLIADAGPPKFGPSSH